MGEIKDRGVGEETQEHLYGKDNPMPAMQTQVERVDLAEREEEHEENKPRQERLEGYEPRVGKGSDDHGEPESVGVEDRF